MPAKAVSDVLFQLASLGKDRPEGVARSDVRDLFGRNKTAGEIDRALTVPEEAGRLKRTSAADGRGRGAENWVPTGQPSEPYDATTLRVAV